MTQSLTQSAIVWPQEYLPGTTDNFVSNEIIVADLTAQEIRLYDAGGPLLSANAHFRFTTFGFPVEAQVCEYEPPVESPAARIAWYGWVEGDEASRLDMSMPGCLRIYPTNGCAS